MVEEENVPVTGALHRLRVLFVRYDPYFDRPGLYQQDHHDYPDNLERFILFCRAVLETVRSFDGGSERRRLMCCTCTIGRQLCAQCI